MEWFCGSMQIELLNREKLRTKMDLGLSMADYIGPLSWIKAQTGDRLVATSQRWTPPSASNDPSVS
jgi:hypothetical protein